MTSPNDPDTRGAFVRLRLHGGRFDAGKGLPVAAMAELIAYEETLQAMARRVFLIRNPARRRVPKEFRDRLALRLTAVHDGSVVPVLDRVATQAQPFLDLGDEFTHARDEINRAIDLAAESGQIDLPDEVFLAFSRFGQTLQPGERITLLATGAESGPSYTAETRRRIMLAREQSYTRTETLLASVFDLNTENRTFRARLVDGAPIPGDYGAEVFDLLKQALRPDPVTVVLDCVVRYAADDRPVRILSVHDLTLDDETDADDQDAAAVTPALTAEISARLDELASLPAGWLDGDGDPISSATLDAARQLLAATSPRLHHPRLYPLTDGGLRIEWTVEPIDLSVEIDTDGGIYAHALNLDTRRDAGHEASTIPATAEFLAGWLD